MRKRILSLVLVAVMLVSLFAAYPMTVSAETATDTFDPDNGDYRISTAADLRKLATTVNNGNSLSGKTITLENDIDLGGSANPWTTISISSAGMTMI